MSRRKRRPEDRGPRIEYRERRSRLQTAIWIPPSLCECRLQITAEFLPGAVRDGVSYQHPLHIRAEGPQGEIVGTTIQDIQVERACDQHMHWLGRMPDLSRLYDVRMLASTQDGVPLGVRWIPCNADLEYEAAMLANEFRMESGRFCQRHPSTGEIRCFDGMRYGEMMMANGVETYSDCWLPDASREFMEEHQHPSLVLSKLEGQLPQQHRGYLFYPLADETPAARLYTLLAFHRGQVASLHCGCATFEHFDEDNHFLNPTATCTSRCHPRFSNQCWQHKGDTVDMKEARAYAEWQAQFGAGITVDQRLRSPSERFEVIAA